MNDVYDGFFSKMSTSNETDYLAFLSSQVPEDISRQLTHDAHPDLSLDPYVELDDLIQPLTSHSFTSDSASQSSCAMRLAFLLEYIILGYVDLRREDDPYKQIYAASYCLHSFLHARWRCRHYTEALVVLVNAAARVGLEGRLQVCRFIGSLIPLLKTASVADPTPMSSALTALSTILGGTVHDVSVMAERAMQEEE